LGVRFPGSGVRGFPSRARVSRRGFWRPLRRGFWRGFSANRLTLSTVSGGNPRADQTVSFRNGLILSSLSIANPAHAQTVCVLNGLILSGVSRPSLLLSELRPGLRQGRDERPRARGRRRPPLRRRGRGSRSDLAGIGDLPAVGVPAPATGIQQHQLPAADQALPRAAVGALRNPRSEAQLVGRESLEHAACAGERCGGGQQQPRGTPTAAVGEYRLEQRRVDLPLPPRTLLREHQPHRARSPAPASGPLHLEQPPPHELLTGLQITGAAQPRSRRRRRRPRPRHLVDVRVAGQRERHQPLARGEVVSRERGRDRHPAHRNHPRRRAESVRGIARLHPCPDQDQELL
jgi:hypothetical protein